MRHGIAPHDINISPGCIEELAQESFDPSASRQDVCRELGIPSDSRLVGAAGCLEWHKGVDLFVQLAIATGRRMPDVPIHFVWLGGDPKSQFAAHIRYDASKAGVADRIHLLGPKTNPLDYLKAIDVFAMTSREDSFPLVVLESASVGKPVVCFDGAGGAQEFVEDDCGCVVPYLAVNVMAEKLVGLLRNGELRERLGRNAQTKVRDRHNVDATCRKLLSVIDDVVNSHRNTELRADPSPNPVA